MTAHGHNAKAHSVSRRDRWSGHMSSQLSTLAARTTEQHLLSPECRRR